LHPLCEKILLKEFGEVSNIPLDFNAKIQEIEYKTAAEGRS